MAALFIFLVQENMSSLRRAHDRYRTWAGLIVLLLIAWCVYLPGLSGGFLFDDFINLSSLGSSGPIRDWPNFWRYLSSGTADPIGRPLALLSFLIDARDWPADPRPFLRTNILLHLLNGALLFGLLRRLGRLLDASASRNDAVALLAAGLWMLHPLFVSTTLYVVQREAMLPTSFVLLGLSAFTIGRTRFAESDGASGAAWMVLGIGLGSALAMACKANGILLPMLSWVLEATVFRAGLPALPGKDSANRLFRLELMLLVLPSLLVLAYLGSFLPHWNEVPGDRDWTIGQRLLTEPRILLDYVRLLVLPNSTSSGLYNDNYAAASGFWPQFGALLAALVWLGLGYVAFRLRRTWPRSSAAVLFYIAGQCLESTIVPLELYFEHRNYLPALLLFWPVAYAICSWKAAWGLRALVASALIALCALTTYQRAEIWANQPRLIGLWISQNPGSSRALATAAMRLVDSKQPQLAIALLTPRWRQRPEDVQLAVNVVDAACARKGLEPEQKRAMAFTLRTTHQDRELAFRWLARIIVSSEAGDCAGLRFDDAQSWVLAASNNPYLSQRGDGPQRIAQLRASIALEKKDPKQAMDFFGQALRAGVKPEVALKHAAQLASHAYYREALAHLDYYETIDARLARPNVGMPWLHAKVLEWQGYWPQEMAWMRSRLRAEIDAQAKAETH